MLTLLQPKTVSAPRPRSLPTAVVRRAWHPHLAAALLIVASTLASCVYVCWLTPLTLSPDEAHYWDWSRNLDWSYYSKGPLVAWLIRASCEVLGPLSIALTGDLAAALRFPAVLCHGATLIGWYILAAGVFRSRGLGLAVLACAATLPLVRAGSVLMTIDPPFMVCWCWALVCVWRALETDRTRWWLGAGALTAVGILAKYTMALFPAAVVGFLLFHRRGEFRKPGVWLLIAGSALGWVPVVAWNAGHDWVSFRHVFGQVGVGGRKAGGVFHFLGGQLGMLFGFWLFAFLAAAWKFRPTQSLGEGEAPAELSSLEISARQEPRPPKHQPHGTVPRETNTGIRLLWWASVPVWLLFAVASFVKSGQPNWPAPSYLGGIVLAVAWTCEQFMRRPRLTGFWLAFSTLLGFVVIVGLHFPDVLRPVLSKIVKAPTPTEPFPVRHLDPTARIAGWKQLAGEVDAVRARVRSETGSEPVVAGTHWTVPGLMGFYCPDHPTVYAIGIANRSDRHSQYDVWRPNPVADAQAFRGRTFVIVGDIGAEVVAAFERVESPMRVVHASNGIPLSGWAVWVCHGFRGFEHATPPSTGSHY